MNTISHLTLDEHGLFTDKPGDIATYSGGRIDPLAPWPDEIKLEDIARGLSNACRWNGQCRFYSVAEHSVKVSQMVPSLEALMHDASEAYLNDMARPIKTRTELGRLYLEHEKELEQTIAETFGLEYPWSQEIKDADYAMGFAEAKVLVPHLGALMPPADRETPPVGCWEPDLAYHLFLMRYEELGGGL